MNPILAPMLMGVVRIGLTAGVSWLSQNGYIGPSGHDDLVTVAFGALMAGWQAWDSRPRKLVENVASMKGTEVSAQGANIRIVEPSLREAALKAATMIDGKKAS